MASFDEGELAAEVGRIIRGARLTVGWSQVDLGHRARIPQASISRLERGVHSGADFDDLQRVAKALGGRFHVRLEAPFLADRGRQRDRVHAACIGYVVRHLRAHGWRAESEVEIGGTFGPGWIDILAWHPQTGALLVIEIKTEIHDFGRVQRTLAWYERGAWVAARGLGWSPRRVHGALLLLDTAVVASALRANRALANVTFPERATSLATFVADPAREPLRGRAVATVDPVTRRAAWLRSTSLDRRPTPPAYADYADAARRLAR